MRLQGGREGVRKCTDAALPGRRVRERAELRAEQRVRLADGDGDLEEVARGRNVLCGDSVLREPFRNLGNGHRRGPYEFGYLGRVSMGQRRLKYTHLVDSEVLAIQRICGVGDSVGLRLKTSDI